MGDQYPEIEGLCDEHRQLLTVTAALRRATGDAPDGRAEGLTGLFDSLAADLAWHTQREEAGLFHILRRIELTGEYVGRFAHDHGYLDDLLEMAREDARWVPELIEKLEAHITREETDMFPAAEQLLGPAEWDAVDEAVADLRRQTASG